jgi:hypothetical protein
MGLACIKDPHEREENLSILRGRHTGAEALDKLLKK